MIIFVDEDQQRSELYREELVDKGLPVKFFASAPAARSYISDAASIDLAILDVMMPTEGEFDAVEAMDGLRTGILLYRQVRQRWPHVPVFFLTNLSRGEFQSLVAGDANVRIRLKPQVLYDEFAEEVAAVYAEGKRAR